VAQKVRTRVIVSDLGHNLLMLLSVDDEWHCHLQLMIADHGIHTERLD